MPSILRPLQLDESPTDTPVLAKSRRKETPAQKSHVDIINASYTPSLPSIQHPSFSFLSLKEYLLHLPILLIGLGLYIGVLFILNTVEPKVVQNVWIQNSYAPLLILVGAAHFCFFSYVFLNTRRGFLASLYLSTILFLKLQQVLTPSLILWTALAIIVVEAMYILLHQIFFRFHHTLTLPKMRVPKLPSIRHGRKRKHHFFGK